MASTNHPLYRQDSVIMNDMPAQMLDTQMEMPGPVPQPVESNGVSDTTQEMMNPALPIVSTDGNPFKLS